MLLIASPSSIHPPPLLVRVRETGGTFAKLHGIHFFTRTSVNVSNSFTQITLLAEVEYLYIVKYNKNEAKTLWYGIILIVYGPNLYPVLFFNSLKALKYIFLIEKSEVSRK